MEKHMFFMQKAIAEAKKAQVLDEVPIGAIAVIGDRIVARAHNLREKRQNPLGHAEIILLEKLAKKEKRWRLIDVTVYVTCEPCVMCAGALYQARVSHLFYGCKDPKAGACGSLYNIVSDARLNHRIHTQGGLLEKACAKLLSDFFDLKRASKQVAKRNVVTQ